MSTIQQKRQMNLRPLDYSGKVFLRLHTRTLLEVIHILLVHALHTIGLERRLFNMMDRFVLLEAWDWLLFCLDV